MKVKLIATPSEETVKTLHDSVFTIGTFKPKFNPHDGKVFADELTILGTAFKTESSNTLITCMHVIDNLLKQPLELAGLLVVGYKGNFYRTIVSSVDYQHDLATLQIVDPFDMNTASSLRIAKQKPKQSEKVCWAGYPLGTYTLNQVHDPTYNEGVIGIASTKDRDINRKYIQISGVVVGGYSGSPVILARTGDIIGVISNGPENSGIFMAVSFEHVQALTNLVES